MCQQSDRRVPTNIDQLSGQYVKEQKSICRQNFPLSITILYFMQHSKEANTLDNAPGVPHPRVYAFSRFFLGILYFFALKPGHFALKQQSNCSNVVYILLATHDSMCDSS